jgi:hypothetical protein
VDAHSAIFVTQHTQYWVSDGVCVAARRSDNDPWDNRFSNVIGTELIGGMCDGGPNRPMVTESPSVGYRLIFTNNIATSPVVDVRPAPVRYFNT